MKRKLVHLLLVDADGFCRRRMCGADDAHRVDASTFLESVTCHDCIVALYFPVRS